MSENSTFTFAMLKPTPVREGNVGAMLSRIEAAGFRITALELLQFSRAQAERFYIEHGKKPFFEELCSYITSSPVVALRLEKENAVADFRKLIGATDPAKAAKNTLRALFGKSLDDNAVHGSDSPDNALREIAIVFG